MNLGIHLKSDIVLFVLDFCGDRLRAGWVGSTDFLLSTSLGGVPREQRMLK